MVEKNTHFQHLFAFPRFAVVPGYEHKAFIPYTNAFSESTPPDSTSIVQGKAVELLKDRVVVETGKGEKEEIEYEYLVLATGTKLTPPGTLHTEGKVDGIKYFQDHQAAMKKAERIVIIGGGAVGIRKSRLFTPLPPAFRSYDLVTDINILFVQKWRRIPKSITLTNPSLSFTPDRT